jgi:Na+-driven multidrug efflux pump
MVGHFVGYTANAAIGVSWQVIIVVIVFISSVFPAWASSSRASPARTGPTT